jgi:uncharacterized lipoprotein YbaY
METKIRFHAACGAILPLLCCMAILLSSCSSVQENATHAADAAYDYGVITGSITYPGTYSFSDAAMVVDIALIQHDFVTGATREISHQRIRNPQRFPVNFTIRYSLKDILPYLKYSIEAEVSKAGDTIPYLKSVEPVWVLTGGNGNRADLKLAVR